MIIEGLLTKIAAAVLKKAAIGGILKWIVPAIEIYSVFDTMFDLSDCVETTNDSQELAVHGLQVVSEPLLNETMDRLLTLGETTFEVQKTDGGLFIANSLTPRFSFNLDNFKKSELSSIYNSLRDLRILIAKIEKIAEYYPGAGLVALFSGGIPGHEESLEKWRSIHKNISSRLEKLFPEFSNDHKERFDFYFEPFEGPLFEWTCADEKTITMSNSINAFYSEIEHLEKFIIAAKKRCMI